MGIYYSCVKPLKLEHWGERALKMMSLGGNKNLHEFLKKYDLAGDSVEHRYKTKAADFYRYRVSSILLFTFVDLKGELQLMSIVEGQTFEVEEPEYEEGRELIKDESLSETYKNFFGPSSIDSAKEFLSAPEKIIEKIPK